MKNEEEFENHFNNIKRKYFMSVNLSFRDQDNLNLAKLFGEMMYAEILLLEDIRNGISALLETYQTQ